MWTTYSYELITNFIGLQIINHMYNNDMKSKSFTQNLSKYVLFVNNMCFNICR